MRLIIAEKPSLGKLIAETISTGKNENSKMSIKLPNGDMVCWAAGHILEQAPPDKYDSKYEKWRVEDLPIIPEVWKMLPKEKAKDLLTNIQKMFAAADTVIHAGDADREGQLLIDELLEFFGYKGEVLRLWITDPSIEGIQAAYQNMKPNSDYIGLRDAALGRQRADWLVGMNLTRGYSKAINRGRLVSMGRVQTPTLAMVVARDHEVENFISKPFFEVFAELVVSNGQFRAKWIPDKDKVDLDEQGHLLDKETADRIARTLQAQIGNITKAERKETKTAPPLTYKVAALQIDCSNEYDFSPADTLKILQSLYEARIVTYPRTDCPYLPEALFDNRTRVLETISAVFSALAPAIANEADQSQKSKAWDNSKIEEHHGIIPTGVRPPASLSDEQTKVYELIARRYVAQFMPDQRHDTALIEGSVSGELFRAKTKTEIAAGWQSLYPKKERAKDEGNTDENSTPLPAVVKGEAAAARELEIEQKKTTPPERFTEATLLAAMVNAHKYVQDPEIKAVLKEDGGIGTGATQAQIIQVLFAREYIEKERKTLKSTAFGRKVVEIAPPCLQTPDMSALWEQELRQIKTTDKPMEDFIAAIGAATSTMIRQLTEKTFDAETLQLFTADKKTTAARQEDHRAPCKACGKAMVQRIGKNGKFWVCYDCGLIVNDNRGKPELVGKCPECGSIAVRIKGKNGYFWACRAQACKKTYSEDKIKPLKGPKKS